MNEMLDAKSMYLYKSEANMKDPFKIPIKMGDFPL
jgi:hypothetical protein